MSQPDPRDREYVLGKDMLKALHDAGLLPQYPKCTRVVIDIRNDALVEMYVDHFPSGALLNIAPLMPDLMPDDDGLGT